MGAYTWLYMVIDGHGWLYMIMDGYGWVFMDYKWLLVVIHGY